MSSIRLRPLAQTDLVDRTRYYRAEVGDEVAKKFFDAAISTLRLIEKMPALGALRIGEQCGVVELRSLRVSNFPCGWFYFEEVDHVDIVRLLSYAQDLPTLFQEFNEDD